MCFSAGASFAAGAVLSAAGVATVREARKPTQRLFATIPFLFGIQQFAEGVLWITLRSGEYEWLQSVAIYAFLIPAIIIWPVVVPLSMWFMEEVKNKKNILAVLVVVGGILSLFNATCLIVFNIAPQINSFHIQYVNNFPQTLVDIAYLFYIVAVIAPLFVSSVRRMWLLGVLIIVSWLITVSFFEHYLISVWCFFAAFSSMVIYWILRKSQVSVTS